jgi:hypothetical protein
MVSGVKATAEFVARGTKRGSRKQYELHRNRIEPALARDRDKFVAATLAKAALLDPSATWQAAHELDQQISAAVDAVRAAGARAADAPASNTAPYFIDEKSGHTMWNGEAGNTPRRLARFSALITSATTVDDGAETTTEYAVTARTNGRTRTLRVPTRQFASIGWVSELGHDFILEPGQGNADRFRHGVMLLSQQQGVAEKTTYAHLGWREIGGEHVYLHAAGAIGSSGSVNGIQVALAGSLAEYRLPSPPTGDELVSVLAAALNLAELNRRAMIPLLGGVFRVVLPLDVAVDTTISLTGATGHGKSTFAALAQCFFGPAFRYDHLPASWSSTSNALEAQAFYAKDAALVIDDWAPGGSRLERQQLLAKADRVMRNSANHAARDRLDRNSQPRAARPPRGLLISTTEEIAGAQSLVLRQFIVQLGAKLAVTEDLNAAQELAARGVYASAMAAYIRWIAADYSGCRATYSEEFRQQRAALHQAHPSWEMRIVADVAHLMVGWLAFMDFVVECGVVTVDVADTAMAGMTDVASTLATIADEQGAAAQQADPVLRYFELLNAAMLGGTAYIATISGNPVQPSPEAYGWHGYTNETVGGISSDWRPRNNARLIGWIDDENLYLHPASAFAVASREALLAETSLGLNEDTLRRRLDQRKLLVSKDAGRLTTRVTTSAGRPWVLHLRRETLENPVGCVSPRVSQVSHASQNGVA